MIRLYEKEVQDRYARDNFVSLASLLNTNPFTDVNFRKFEVDLKSGDNVINHSFGFPPLHVVVTYISSDTATVRVKHSLSTNNTITINSDEPCKIRFFIGK